MSNKMNLLTVYDLILRLGGFSVDEEGCVSNAMGKVITPATLNVESNGKKLTKRLVLPIPSQLKDKEDPLWESRIAFHIFKESLLKGETPTTAYFRNKVNHRLNLVFKAIFKQLLEFASQTDKQKNIPEHIELLKNTSGLNEKNIKTFNAVFNAIKITALKSGSFCSIYLKKSGKIGDSTYACVCVVNFPLYEEFLEFEQNFSTKDGKNVFKDQTFRKADVQAFKDLFQCLIPEIDKQVEDGSVYNIGIGESYCPFAEALLRGVYNIAQPLNKVATILLESEMYTEEEKKALEPLMLTDTSYIEALDDFESLVPEIKLIPTLPGIEEDKTHSTKTKARAVENRWGTITPEQVPVTPPPPTFQQQLNQQTNQVYQPPIQPQQYINQAPVSRPTGNTITASDIPWLRPAAMQPQQYGQVNTAGMLRSRAAQQMLQQNRQPQYQPSYNPYYGRR